MKTTLYNTINRLVFITILFVSNYANAQYDLREAEYNDKNEVIWFVPASSWNKTANENLPEILKQIYGLKDKPEMRLISKFENSESNSKVYRYQQYLNGIEVEGGEIIIRRDEKDLIHTVLGSFRNISNPGLHSITESEALDIAIAHLGPDKYYLWLDSAAEAELKWVRGDLQATYYPKGKLVYYHNILMPETGYNLCYFFEIYSAHSERMFIYVNARTGIIENSYNAVTDVNGTGKPMYGANDVAFRAARLNDTTFYLEDSIRKIYTDDCNYDSALNLFYFLSKTSYFTGGNSMRSGVSAHYGATKTFDFYKTKFNRNSYDGAGAILLQRVNFRENPSQNYDNAFWNGVAMFYGDGGGATDWNPIVAMDDVGHEITHAFIEKTANLIYQAEPGALNEAWADILGMAVEAYAGDKDWLQSEDSYKLGDLRNMKEPKNSGGGACPNCYKKQHWAPLNGGDHGGVHTNSGVANFWFYLITDGGNGVNDNNKNYDVKKLDLATSQKIAWRALERFMVRYTDYANARKATLLACEDLGYDKDSKEYKSVCEAWFAVGVGDKCCDSVEVEFDITDTKCHDSKDGAIDLEIVKPVGPFNPNPFVYKWFKGDTTSSVLATTQDLNDKDSGKYVVIVRDTVAKCQVVETARIKAPEKLKVDVSGGGTFTRSCDRSFTVTLRANASGGTAPYTYNWANARHEVVCSGRNSFTRKYTCNVRDKNNCTAKGSAIVKYIAITCSYDPNDIIGPPSFGDEKWVSINATLPYKIRYENDPKFATGPAQKVTIDHVLDSNVDLTSFRLGSFGFKDYIFNVPKNSSYYTERLDIRDSFNIYLDVVAGIDISTRKAFWVFESIDPNTGLPPTDARGYLAINDTITHKGEGFVNYTIKPKSTSKTGDSIRAKAVIVFDDNPEVLTPKIHNLIDAKPPVSAIQPMPSVVDSTIVPIKLAGQDDAGGSGLESYNVFVSENHGTYKLALEQITDSIAYFKGNFGSSYRAYSQAVDNTGNTEDTKTNPDVTFNIASENFFKDIDSTTSLCTGDTLEIKYYKSPFSSITLEYTADSGKTYKTFATGVSGYDSSYSWVIPSDISGTKWYFMRAIVPDNSLVLDTSDYFKLSQGPVINLGTDTGICDNVNVNLTLDAGAGHASYKWSDNSTGQTLVVSAYGKYSVEVTSSTGCKSTDEIEVFKHAIPSVISKTLTDIKCFGDSTGAIDIMVNLGAKPYTFLWSNSTTMEDLTDAKSGQHIVIITDQNKCVISDTSNLSQPAAPISVSVTQLNVDCFGNASGSIDVTPSGGTPSYTYSWTAGSGGSVPSGQANAQDLSGLSAGTYTLVITDANNCTYTQIFNITQPAAALSSSSTQVNVACFGNSTGSIDLSVSGGTAGYTYAWTASNGGAVPGGQSSNQDLSGLVAGDYSVTVTDANNCQTTHKVSITQPSAALSSSVSSKNVDCFGNSTGSIDLTVSGGTAGYTYAWTASGGGIVPSGQASNQDLTSLSAGTYQVTITDANNCTNTNSSTITQPSAALSSSNTKVNVLCFGNATGSIDLTVSGGTAGYTYNWTASNGGSVPSGQVNSQDLTGLLAGDYKVTITDANNCTLVSTITISQPASAIASSIAKKDVDCFGNSTGSIDLSVSGGTGAYTYSWVASGGGSVPSGQNNLQDLSGLSPGVYTVTIKDANNCSRNDAATITQPSAALSSTATKVDVLCFGDASGSIDLSVNGGTSPYSYSWTASGGGSIPSGQSSNQDLSGLIAGNYSVFITDANNCQTSRSLTISEPFQALKSSLTKVDVLCRGNSTGSIDITVTGGTSGYSYSWVASNGGTVPSGQSTNQDLINITAGTYTVTITDANNCTTTNSATITQPGSVLSSSRTFVNVACFGNSTGSIDLTVSGGTPGYTYSWSASSGGTVPSGQANNQDLTNLVPGVYSVTITDANNCITTNSATITQPSAALTSSKTQINVDCFGNSSGSIDLTVSGGTSGYTYAWTASGGGTVPSGQSGNQDLTGLKAGVYSVTITDANNCTTTNSATITQPAAALSSSLTQVNVLCFGNSTGSIDLTVNGGTTGYSYSWTASGGGSVPTGQANNQDLTGLVAGTYTVLITDANNCTTTNSATITQPAAALASTKTQVDILCYGDASGSIDLTVGGGTSPYTYTWTGSGGGTVPSGQINNQDLSGLTAGTYSVLITDNNGCTSNNSVILLQPAAPLDTALSKINVLCYGDATGSIDLTITGGTKPYFYNWSASSGGKIPVGQTGLEDLNNIVAGNYSVGVTDDNGCTIGASVRIYQPSAPLNIVLNHLDVLCYGDATGSADLTVTGGTSPYTFQWSSGDVTEDISNKTTGKYIITVTDANLCTLTDSVFIDQPSAPLSSTLSMVPVNCYAGNDGTTDLSISGGTAPYSFMWSNGKTTEDLQDLMTGMYKIVVTDKNNCILSDSIFVTQPLAALGTSISKEDVKCFAGNDGSADLSVTGGTTPYTFSWSNLQTTEDVNNLVSGKYKVLVTDKNLCTIIDSVDIGQPTAPLSSVINAKDVNCFAGSDGEVTLTVSGGTVPYTYQWSNGETTKDINTLILGRYSVLITDKNNCLLRDSIDVAQPSAPLSSVINIENAKCNGSSDGSLDLTVNGGTTPYTYSWSNAATTEDINNLLAGQYIVTITDNNLCVHSDTATVNEPTPLVATIDGTSANLGVANGKIWVTTTGGTVPYTYKWVDFTDDNDTIYNVKVGSYGVTVTDSNGCNVVLNIEVPEAPNTADIVVFPNPSRGILTVTNLESFGLDLPITFELFDLVGKRQMKFEVIGKDVHTFDIPDYLYNNAYILKMSNERFDEIRKVFLLR
ncbi:MAG: M4 family metallopeptidase [Flavobacteriales bacterium]|nr:M4 family metallopeptidase [Flavobacteriales bacterium]